MNNPTIRTNTAGFRRDLRPPRVALPEGACDAHMHIVGAHAEYPFTATRSLSPPVAAWRDYEGVMRTLGVLTYEARGIERLGQPAQLIVANHPSLIDVVFLIAFAPRATCVVKEALWRNPVTRAAVVEAGYVSNAPTDRMIAAACAALRGGQSVIIFPEGTRTTPGRPMQFHRGAAAIAIQAAHAITPVFVRCTPTTLSKNEPWYRIPKRRVRFSLQVGPDIDPAPFRDAAPAPLASRALNEHLLSVFSAELAH